MFWKLYLELCRWHIIGSGKHWLTKITPCTGVNQKPKKGKGRATKKKPHQQLIDASSQEAQLIKLFPLSTCPTCQTGPARYSDHVRHKTLVRKQVRVQVLFPNVIVSLRRIPTVPQIDWFTVLLWWSNTVISHFRYKQISFVSRGNASHGGRHSIRMSDAFCIIVGHSDAK